MAEKTHPKSTSDSSQTSSADVKKAMPDHEVANASGTEVNSHHTAGAEPNAEKNGQTIPDGTPPQEVRVHGIAKFSTTTEKEIRALMHTARSVQDGGKINEEDVAKLAALTSNLIQIMNAEYIAKDTIVRAVAYMRGESQLSARRALGQAQRDRRAARRNNNNGNNGQRTRDKTEQSKGNSDATDTKPVDDGKSKDSKSATPNSSGALPSDASYEGTAITNGTSSEKEDTPPAQPKNKGASAAKAAKKKRYWQARRQARKNSTNEDQSKNGVAGTAEENHVKHGATIVVENGVKPPTKDGQVVAAKDGAIVPDGAQKQPKDKPIVKVEVSEDPDELSAQATDKQVTVQA